MKDVGLSIWTRVCLVYCFTIQWVSAPPKGAVAVSAGIFHYHRLGEEVKHPAMCVTALPQRNYPAPSSSGAEVQKPRSGFTALKLSFLAPRDKMTFH